MTKKRILISIIGGTVFIASMILINSHIPFIVRVLSGISCLAGAVLFLFPLGLQTHRLIWVRAIWWILFWIVTIPVINIFGYLVIDYHHTLPEHIGYFGGIKTIITLVACFILSEIFNKFNKKK